VVVALPEDAVGALEVELWPDDPEAPEDSDDED
jgi:hypothetical protein